MYKSLDSFKVESMTELLFESDIHVRIALASMLLSTVDERIEMREFDEGHMMDLLSLVKKALSRNHKLLGPQQLCSVSFSRKSLKRGGAVTQCRQVS